LTDKTVRAWTLLGSAASACSESQILGGGIRCGRPFDSGGCKIDVFKFQRMRQTSDDLVLHL
jgi:hypothetical protein